MMMPRRAAFFIYDRTLFSPRIHSPKVSFSAVESTHNGLKVDVSRKRLLVKVNGKGDHDLGVDVIKKW